MANNLDELPESWQMYRGFRKASTFLRQQNNPTASHLVSVSVPQPDKRTSTSPTGESTDFFSDLQNRQKYFETIDKNVYSQRQPSLSNFTQQSSNLIVTNNNNGFIKASSFLATQLQKQNNTEEQKITPKTSKKEHLFKDLKPSSSNTENLPYFCDSNNQKTDYGLDLNQQLPQQILAHHHPLTNPFHFTALRNATTSRLSPLPKRTKKFNVSSSTSCPFQTKYNNSIAYNKKTKAPASFDFPPTKKTKINQFKNQHSITNYVKILTLQRKSTTIDSENSEEEIKTSTSTTNSNRRLKSKLYERNNNNNNNNNNEVPVLSTFSNNNESLAILESLEYSSDEEIQRSAKNSLVKSSARKKDVLLNSSCSSSSSSSDEEETLVDYNLSKTFYGLLGNEPPDDLTTNEDYFKKLPDEVKKIIFCQLPSNQLFEVCPNVCRDWRRVIHDAKFMPWKFRHYCYKKTNWLPNTYVRGYPFCYLTITCVISYMKTQSKSFKDLLPSLKKHEYYNEAKAVLKNALPDCFSDNVPCPWSLITLLIVISDTVESVEKLLHILASASTKSSLDIVLDKVYEILYTFISKKSDYSTSYIYSIIYRLSCALYIFENTGSVTISDLTQSIQQHQQQSIMKFCDGNKKTRFTPEQLQILSHNVKPREIVQIIAFAGTGKTSTLVRYTKMRPGLKFLLVVFNKSVAEHAKTVFPTNVHCTTAHGLAFKHRGFIYAKHGQLHFRNLKVCDLEHALTCENDNYHIIHCQIVMSVLENFFASKDTEIQLHHVQAAKQAWKGDFHRYTSDISTTHWLEDAKTFWHQMIDLNNKNVKMTHDGYLKLYQMRKPKLNKYDIILIDEAQDLTPAIADILLSQNQAKILVGDPFQQIYSFRGAVNLLSDIKPTHTFYLTQSFRFGHEIATVANLLLNYDCKSNMMLIGSPKESTIEGKDIGQVTYISRSNSVLFRMAAYVCCSQKSKVKVFFIGGLESWGFDLLRRLCIFRDEGYFKPSNSSRDALVNKFPTYSALSWYVKESMDSELLPKIQILQQYTSNLHKVLSVIEASEVKDMKIADVIFTTAHKAKGLEFSTVKILDDFTIDNCEERNLLYVALTRAKHSLYLDEKTISLCERFGEQRLKVRLYDSIKDEKFECCNKNREEHDKIVPPIVVEKKKLQLVSGNVTGGFICKKCLMKECSSAAFIYENPDLLSS